MISQQVKKLDIPELPGVYIFRDYQKRPLYIGRATSLKDRTRSYFSNDLIETRGPRIVDMVTKAKTLTWETTDSVLEAIILESALIKKYQPHYNVDERDDKSSYYVVITKEEWPRVFLARARDFDAKRSGDVFDDGKTSYKVKAVFGPYVHSGLIKEALKILRKMFPFKDVKSFDARHNSFYEALGRSPKGTDDNSKRRYQRTIANLILFFEGKKKLLQAKLQRDMNMYAKKMEFEEAQKAKRLIYALDHVNDMALIKEEKNTMRPAGGGQGSQEATHRDFRMEAYDVAHLSGTNVVGAFAVMVDGEFDKSQYRKFILSSQENNDVKNLREILTRRLNHTEWAFPDLIVVDGGEAQLNAAKEILSARRISIPIVGLVKDERHKARMIIGDFEAFKEKARDIVRLNEETHRYTIAFHKKRRGKLV
ncbi:MAG: GIY-YIG nuclease family protein [Patescibacteria group bacterium]